MIPKYYDIDYRLFQSRHYDYEKEAEIERLIISCQQKRKSFLFQQNLSIFIRNIMKYLYDICFQRKPETRQIRTEF